MSGDARCAHSVELRAHAARRLAPGRLPGPPHAGVVAHPRDQNPQIPTQIVSITSGALLYVEYIIEGHIF